MTGFQSKRAMARDKQELVDLAITQFQLDIENMDTTAIEELLFKLDEESLIAYLPEETL
jgi:hypothetical protein